MASCTDLTTHHDIEEQYFFPILAKRMPMFAKNEDGEHIKSHRAIHQGLSVASSRHPSPPLTIFCVNGVGLDDLAALIKKWTGDPASYSPDEMRACLDGWREVLFRHLDEEVHLSTHDNLTCESTIAHSSYRSRTSARRT